MNKNQFKIVLVEPEIPSNTGNIARTCVATNSQLHLVHPLGFEISDKQVKRAGLDYWPHLDLCEHSNADEFFNSVSEENRFFLFTTKTKKSYFENEFRAGDYLIFGPETRGLSSVLLNKFPNNCLTIPMFGPVRSLNLSNAVSIALYEAIRQTNFKK